MAFRIDLSQSASSELQRLMCEQFDYALSCVDRIGGRTSVEAVHELRKSTKKIRAMLRLATDALPRHDFRCITQALRDIARQMAQNRDWDVLEQNLCRAYQTLQPGADLASRPWSNLSLLEHVSNERGVTLDASRGEVIRAQLVRTQETLQQTMPLNADMGDLLRESVKGYRQGRRQLRKLCKVPTAPGLHELRKRVKDQLYQLRLFSNLSPKQLRAEAVDFDQLAELLGEHHDLANLRAAIDASRATFRRIEELEGLSEWTDRKSSELEREALQLAQRLYTKSPKARLSRWISLLADAQAKIRTRELAVAKTGEDSEVPTVDGRDELPRCRDSDAPLADGRDELPRCRDSDAPHP